MSIGPALRLPTMGLIKFSISWSIYEMKQLTGQIKVTLSQWTNRELLWFEFFAYVAYHLEAYMFSLVEL